jgi:hypothetical protein
VIDTYTRLSNDFENLTKERFGYDIIDTAFVGKHTFR